MSKETIILNPNQSEALLSALETGLEEQTTKMPDNPKDVLMAAKELIEGLKHE